MKSIHIINFEKMVRRLNLENGYFKFEIYMWMNINEDILITSCNDNLQFES